MPYGADIDALSPDHTYSFDNTLNDGTGTSNGTNGGTTFSANPICEDVTQSLLTNATTERVTLPDIATIGNSAQARKAVAGWFMPTAIQNPPKVIYAEGNATTAFSFLLGWGNALMFEVQSAATGTIQIYADVVLDPNRAYHLCMIFEGNGYGNEVRAYLDGVEQLDANPVDRQPDTATLAARTPAFFGDPVGTLGVGGTGVTMLAPINGRFNEWAMWGDSANAVLTDTQVREELFEKGALPDVTITNQAGLDALANTVRANAPCCIRITGNGTIDLTADNVTFDPLASIHVQYTGTGTLNWTNTNGSNASIGSTTNGGTINFINPATLTIEGLINGCELRIYDDEIPGDGAHNTELAGTETLSGTSFVYNHAGASNDVVIQMMATGYVEIKRDFTLGSSDQTLTLFPQEETNS